MSHRGLYCYSHVWSCGQGWGMVSPERRIITAGGRGRWVADRAGGGHRVQVVESRVESDIGIGTVAPSIPELTSVSFFLARGTEAYLGSLAYLAPAGTRVLGLLALQALR